MKPKQFNFMKNWEAIKGLKDESGIRYGIERMWQEWIYIAECKHSDPSNVDPLRADAEYELDMLTLKVKKWDRHWLAEWTAGCHDVSVDLALGVAETFYPDKEWEIPGMDEYFVVTDTDRTIVFDFLNFDKLPAGASLVLAGDTKYKPDDFDLNAAIQYKKQSISKLEEVLAKIRLDIEFAEIESEDADLPVMH